MRLLRPSEEIWQIAEPLIKKACLSTKGRFTAEDVKEWLDSGDCQLWIVEHKNEVRAAAVTEILLYPKLKVCRVNIVTGKGRNNWQHFKDGIEEWARKEGCKRIEALARKGWAKVYKDYQQTHIFLEKEL